MIERTCAACRQGSSSASVRGAVRGSSYRIERDEKHTKGNPRSPKNGVFASSDTNTTRQLWQETLEHGAVEKDRGSTVVSHVFDYPVGHMEQEGVEVGTAYGVRAVNSSNVTFGHPYPFDPVDASILACDRCGGPFLPTK